MPNGTPKKDDDKGDKEVSEPSTKDIPEVPVSRCQMTTSPTATPERPLPCSRFASRAFLCWRR
jgi:hypothetical protein